MLLDKKTCIETMERKGFDTTDIIKKLNELVSTMRAVRLGKYEINCVYNGKRLWDNSSKNSDSLDDYNFDICSLKMKG